ncbi:hypothetical protein NKR23_g9778 [Pleurostoma richardsiae]|uniref:Uncharacterized protein n=1 Tax=Pleurostoma richardsiae TaxID=41990 RepID=A0AA38RGF7_9PEZI|nr:hypothetical protein NKR23_g9778 [Pleurostoma richardsiae]
MQLLKLASLAALAGFVAAAPAPQEDDPAPKPPFHIAFTFTNGSFTDPIDFPDTLDVIPTNITELISAVFFSPPGFEVWGRCTLLEPDRQGLGSVEFNKATTRAVDPPAVVGFVQCNSE